MDYLEAVKTLFAGRKTPSPIGCFAGQKHVVFTDKKMFVYMVDDIIDGDMKQIGMPTNLKEISTFDAFSRTFLDPQGEPIAATEIFDDPSGVMGSAMSDVINRLFLDMTEMPIQIRRALVMGVDMSLVADATPGKVVLTKKNKGGEQVTNVLDMDLGPRVGKSIVRGLSVPIKKLVKSDPAPKVIYSPELQCLHMLYDADIKFGVVVPLLLQREDTESMEQPTTPTEPVEVAGTKSTKAPASATAITAAVLAAKNETTKKEENAMPEKKEEEQAPVTTTTPEVTPEATPEATPATTPEATPATTQPAGEPEAGAQAPTDEEKLAALLELMDMKTASSAIRETLLHINKIVSTSTRLAKRKSSAESDKRKIAELRADNAALKKEVTTLRSARDKMLQALGVSA